MFPSLAIKLLFVFVFVHSSTTDGLESISQDVSLPEPSQRKTTTISPGPNTTTVTPPSTTSNTTSPPTPTNQTTTSRPTTIHTTTTPTPTNQTTTTQPTSPTTSNHTTPASTTPVPPTNHTTPSPHPQPAPSDRKFDAFSFLGGFALGLGLVAIGFLSWKFYLSRTENYYHTL